MATVEQEVEVRQHPDAEQLAQVAAALRAGNVSPTVTVRELLRWFGAARRGYWIVQSIRSALADEGLVTVPDFEAAYIDAAVAFQLAADASVAAHDLAGDGAAEGVGGSGVEEDALVSIGIADPTNRIGRLGPANHTPLSVKPDCTLTEAITLMLVHDYAQLPVMTNDRTVKGMLSWKSIGSRYALKGTGSAVRDFMDGAVEVPADRSIFAAITLIVQHDYVLVRGADNRIIGIVTTSDLSQKFREDSEPFLLLGEIENHVRRLIDGRYTLQDLQSAKDPTDEGRVIHSVADLGFGEYIRLLQNPAMWAKLGVPIDRKTFVARLDEVRQIRNDVMHFEPDPLAAHQLGLLRQFAHFLHTLQEIGIS